MHNTTDSILILYNTVYRFWRTRLNHVQGQTSLSSALTSRAAPCTRYLGIQSPTFDLLSRSNHVPTLLRPYTTPNLDDGLSFNTGMYILCHSHRTNVLPDQTTVARCVLQLINSRFVFIASCASTLPKALLTVSRTCSSIESISNPKNVMPVFC